MVYQFLLKGAVGGKCSPFPSFFPIPPSPPPPPPLPCPLLLFPVFCSLFYEKQNPVCSRVVEGMTYFMLLVLGF